MDVQIIRASEFVRVGTSGAFDFENSRAVLVNLANACRKRGIDRALIDIRGASSNLSRNELAALVKVFNEVAVSRRLRLAILHTAEQGYRAKLFAFFSAMHGRHVRAFESFEPGFDWLCGDESGAQPEAGEEQVPIRSREARRTKIVVQGKARGR